MAGSSRIPPPARRSPRRPNRPRPTSIVRWPPRAAARLGGDDAGRARPALLRLADADRGGGRRARRAGGRPTPASRSPAFLEDEIPFMVDNLRFFAGAARCMEGKRGRRVPRGVHVDGPPRAGRRGRPDQPVELPADDGVWKIGPALATGNTIVLKPAPTTPVTTVRLAELDAESLPEGRSQRRHRHGEPVGAALVEHPTSTWSR